MSHAPPLDLIIQVSTDRRNGAAVALAGSRRQAGETQRKLQMLARYRDDYLARIQAGTHSGGTDAVRIANARAFVEKLDQALAQLRRELEACESHASACLELLIANERKLHALQALRERRVQRAGRAETQREQKRSDEFGARAARNGGAILDFRPI